MDIKKFLLLAYECTQIGEKQITSHINCCFYFTCFFFLAFREGSKESIQPAKYDYSSRDHARCQSGSRPGPTGKSDHEQIASGIYFAVRTPLNYDNTIQHPLVIVYAPGGKNRFANERITGLTQEMTTNGFLVAYVDNHPLSIPVINDFSTVPKAIEKK
jgi:polyhydroxybutyrate depolymerase